MFTYLIFIFAVGFLFAGLRGLYESYSNRYWPSVAGRVECSRVETGYCESREESFRFQFAYSYQVAGRKYRSKRFAIVPVESRDRSRIEILAARYPEGSEVTVYHSRLFPSLSLVQKGSSLWPWAILGFGVAALSYGIFVLSHAK